MLGPQASLTSKRFTTRLEELARLQETSSPSSVSSNNSLVEEEKKEDDVFRRGRACSNESSDDYCLYLSASQQSSWDNNSPLTIGGVLATSPNIMKQESEADEDDYQLVLQKHIEQSYDVTSTPKLGSRSSNIPTTRTSVPTESLSSVWTASALGVAMSVLIYQLLHHETSASVVLASVLAVGWGFIVHVYTLKLTHSRLEQSLQLRKQQRTQLKSANTHLRSRQMALSATVSRYKLENQLRHLQRDLWEAQRTAVQFTVANVLLTDHCSSAPWTTILMEAVSKIPGCMVHRRELDRFVALAKAKNRFHTEGWIFDLLRHANSPVDTIFEYHLPNHHRARSPVPTKLSPQPTTRGASVPPEVPSTPKPTNVANAFSEQPVQVFEPKSNKSLTPSLKKTATKATISKRGPTSPPSKDTTPAQAKVVRIMAGTTASPTRSPRSSTKPTSPKSFPTKPTSSNSKSSSSKTTPVRSNRRKDTTQPKYFV